VRPERERKGQNQTVDSSQHLHSYSLPPSISDNKIVAYPLDRVYGYFQLFSLIS